MNDRAGVEPGVRGGGRRRPAVLAILGVILAAAAVLILVGQVQLAREGMADAEFGLNMATLFAGLGLYWGVGTIIVLRADGHLVGWLLATAATMFAVVFGCWATSSAISASDPGSMLAAWFMLVGALLFTPATILIFPALITVFPTGTLPGPRWRWPVRLVLGLVVVQTIAIALPLGPLDPAQPAHPLAQWFPAIAPADAATFFSVLMGIGSLAVPIAIVVGVAAIVVRFRQSGGEQRAQLKWLLAATVPAAILIPLSTTDLGQAVPFLDVATAATLPLIAVAVAVAILRYRLYDIDRVISRSISYGVVTGMLVAIFLVVNLALQGILSSVTTNNALAVAGSTLLVAALFTPVRRRVQRIVDRRFDRARYDGERTASAFSTRMRDAIDLPAVAADLDGTVREAMAPTGLGLWLRGSGR